MKEFNTTGLCVPEKHYMVDLGSRLEQIKIMVDEGKYFTINRARQYGKTTTLAALSRRLKDDYMVVSLDFQAIGNGAFTDEGTFSQALARAMMDAAEFRNIPIPAEILAAFEKLDDRETNRVKIDDLFRVFLRWCKMSELPLVLMVDEVDSATNNQVFLDFLAQLRLQYLERAKDPKYRTFQSVILAGVTDVRNLRRKLRPEETHKFNSPWNIAADFNVDMSLTKDGIAGMLAEYEADHQTGMDTAVIAREIEGFTDGYPYLVSRICQLMDTRLTHGSRFTSLSQSWTPEGVSEAVRRILAEKNALFDSLIGKVNGNAELRAILEEILFGGVSIPYNVYDTALADAEMYGFIRNRQGVVDISNRIFETLLYNFFLSIHRAQEPSVMQAGENAKEQFIADGRLQMEPILTHYATVFGDLYGDQDERFSEAEGRRRFLLFIRPIINGTGNYYIEAETRSRERMDLVIDYLGERHVIELKIWRGATYHEKGERQLAGYLEYNHLKKGYLLTYRFTHDKKPGISRRFVDGKELIEAFV